MTEQQTTALRPYRVEIPQADLDDLRDRLARTRWTSVVDGADGEYGTALSRVRRLAEYWRDGFDWRAFEARLNAHPQFLTEIDGQDIHFLNVKSDAPNGTALLLTHGWPGSQAEYLDVIEPLTAAGYDLVIPSIPGYGFAGPTTEKGWNLHRTARAWVELMARLGYERYGAVGNDGGSMISPEVGRLDPDHCVGVHVTQLFSFPSGDPAEMAELTDEEKKAVETLQWFWENMGSFNQVQSQQPQTLAHALSDSPAACSAGTSSCCRRTSTTTSCWPTSPPTGSPAPPARHCASTARWPWTPSGPKARPRSPPRWPAREATSSASAASPSATTRTSCGGTSTRPPATTPRTRLPRC